MLQAKYKAHRFINIIFYIIVFLIGFYMGLFGQKIGIKDIFQRILFIDNVQAIDVPSDTFTRPTSSNWYKESTIIDIFNSAKNYLQLDISFNDYKNVYAISRYGGVYDESNNYTYLFSTSSFFGNSNQIYTNGAWLTVWLDYHGTPSYSIYYGSASNNQQLLNTGITYYLAATSSPIHTIKYQLDFSNYYGFNEDLFSNNSDFKEVCIDPKKRFIISSETMPSNKTEVSDYIWFPYNIGFLVDGIYNPRSMDFSMNTLDTQHIFFNSSEDFDYFDTTSGLTKYLILGNSVYFPSFYSYNDRLSFYGWNAYPFSISFLNEDSPLLPVFQFSSSFTTITLNDGIAHGGSGRRIYDTTDENNSNLQMCFYINKYFTVSELEQTSDGEWTGSIITPNGEIQINSIDDDSQINDYFDYFDNDNFGLSAIITAPLNSISQISSGVCTPQNISILGNNIALPCGDTLFWDRQDVQPFKIFWNMFAGGIIAYGIGVSIFNSVRHFKDPDDDKVEVIDL